MRRMIRFIDWRLIVSITVLLIVVSAIHSSLATAQDRDRLAAEAVRKDRIAAAERRDASAERARILEGQRRLEEKYDALLATQRRIVGYVNARGIFIPESVFDGSSDSDDDSDGNDGGSNSGSPSTGGSGKQLPPKSGPTSNGNDSSAGGSGKGHGAGGGHDKGHGSSSSKGHSGGKAKGDAKGKSHKR